MGGIKAAVTKDSEPGEKCTMSNSEAGSLKWKCWQGWLLPGGSEGDAMPCPFLLAVAALRPRRPLLFLGVALLLSSDDVSVPKHTQGHQGVNQPPTGSA